MSEDNDSASGRQVISRAAAVLRALAEDNSGQSLGQIAKKTDLPRTTVHRIVAALEAQQLAATTPAGVRLEPGAGAAGGLGAYRRGRRRALVEALGRRLRETVDLCVFRGQHAVSVDQFASDQELRVVAAVGTAYPIHCTAHGRPCWRAWTTRRWRRCWARGWNAAPPTPSPRARICWRSWPSPDPGWALDLEEHAVGICGIGVHIETGQSEQYALSVALPAARYEGQLDACLAALFQCKAEIESLLAGTHGDPGRS